MTAPSTGMQPISLLRPTDLLPRKYVLHRHTQRCKNCGGTEVYTHAYAHNEGSARWFNKPFTNLVPITEFIYNLPLEVVDISVKDVAVCNACSATISLSHLQNITTQEQWQKLYNRTWEAPKPPSTSAPKRAAQDARKKAPPTIDDLLNL